MDRPPILVVDDDPLVLQFLKDALTRAGHSVQACDRFEEAKAALAAGRPSLLLTDVRLGAYNGLQLALVASQKYPGIPIIVLTGYDDPTLRDEAARSGATFVMKPLALDTLIARVDAALGKAG